MPSPNENQAVYLLRRLRADTTRQEAEKAAKALIEQIRAQGAELTIEGVLRTALASHPDQDAFSAVQIMAQEIARAGASNSEVQRLFSAAVAKEEQRLAPFDEACAIRLEQIKDAIDQAHRVHREKILGQDRDERRWKSYTDKGLSREEILKLEIREPNPNRDFLAERNQWAAEFKQTIQALTSERDAIYRFKNTRYERALPESVLALVEVQA